jgi:2-iminobutanoate/2-iminopropanoate deaminase
MPVFLFSCSHKNKQTIMRETIFTKNAPAPIGPYSQGVRAGNTWYFSGQIALIAESGQMAEGGVEAQAKQVMENIKALLTASGLEFGDIVKTTIFLKSMDDFPKVNAIYGSYFSHNIFPARETVEVSRLPKDALVEISVTCVK